MPCAKSGKTKSFDHKNSGWARLWEKKGLYAPSQIAQNIHFSKKNTSFGLFGPDFEIYCANKPLGWSNINYFLSYILNKISFLAL
ncbi:MAG: hypothetical protein AAFV25_11695 [Bacteroidota bacterium]